MKLFSKLKDYNNLLEEILDRKTFSSVAKSLLLSMFYKLEVAYKDYEQVKVDCVSKDVFLNHLLNIIQKYCEHIKTVEPESIQANLLIQNKVEALTNAKERSILTYPTEQAILYAISDIEPKYFFVKKDFGLKNVLQKILVEGYKENTIEILKNFNGWSWDINPKQKQNYIANLIYQNLMMIMGEQFLYDWRTDNRAKKDYLQTLKNRLKKITGNEHYYISLCKVLYLIANKKEKETLKKQFGEKKEYEAIINHSNSEDEEVVQLQKYFLKFMEKKIAKLELTEEIVQIIYELRYYQNIVLFENGFIKDDSRFKKNLDYTLKLAITKACKMGVMKIISMDIETNFECIKYILDTRIIHLEDIKIELEFEKSETLLLKVYEKQTFEKQGRNEFHGNKKDIQIKTHKKINLFN